MAEVFYRDERHAQAPQLAPDGDGFIWMPEEGFRNVFAQHATADQIAVPAAVQRPISLKCIQEPVAKPAWRSKPSWFLIAEERPHDQPQDTTLYGEPMRATTRSLARRSRAAAYRATEGCGHSSSRRSRQCSLERMRCEKLSSRSRFAYPNQTAKGGIVNSVAIVTGASQGIGRSTAIRLAHDFSAIVLVARNADGLKEVAVAVKTAGAEPFTCVLDLSKLNLLRYWSRLRLIVSAGLMRC